MLYFVSFVCIFDFEDVLGIITGDWGIEPTQIGKSKRDIRLTDKNKDEVRSIKKIIESFKC